MQTVSTNNFGIAIAYLVPGFVALWGVSVFSPTVSAWLYVANSQGSPTIGGFLYVTLAALAAGLVASTVRWMILDSVHNFTGVRKPDWQFDRLQKSLGAYKTLEENHYRYYQFYGNTLVASLFSYVSIRLSVETALPNVIDLGFAALAIVFFIASRDTLEKYYRRVDHLLSDSIQ